MLSDTLYPSLNFRFCKPSNQRSLILDCLPLIHRLQILPKYIRFCFLGNIVENTLINPLTDNNGHDFPVHRLPLLVVLISGFYFITLNEVSFTMPPHASKLLGIAFPCGWLKFPAIINMVCWKREIWRYLLSLQRRKLEYLLGTPKEHLLLSTTYNLEASFCTYKREWWLMLLWGERYTETSEYKEKLHNIVRTSQKECEK